MPTSTNLYFWADDNRDEAEIFPNANFKEIPSIWGHAGGILAQTQERGIVDKAIIELDEAQKYQIQQKNLSAKNKLWDGGILCSSKNHLPKKSAAITF